MKRTSGTICIILGLLLIAAALGLTGYNIWDSDRAGRASAEITDRLLEVMPERAEYAIDDLFMDYIPGQTEQPEDSHIGTESMDPAIEAMAVVEVEEYRYIGILEIPKLKITLPVMETWDYDRLQIAPCRYTGNVYSNDLVICAHNFEKHFGPLFGAEPGMEVYFSAVDGRVYKFVISNVEEVDPHAIDYMTKPNESGGWDLTLFTCFLGGRSRCAVRCVRV